MIGFKRAWQWYLENMEGLNLYAAGDLIGKRLFNGRSIYGQIQALQGAWQWYLEDMEGLKLYAAGGVLEQQHHLPQVVRVRDVSHHHLHVCPVQEQLPEKLHPHIVMSQDSICMYAAVLRMPEPPVTVLDRVCQALSSEQAPCWEGSIRSRRAHCNRLKYQQSAESADSPHLSSGGALK